MGRFLTPSKITLLALAQVYTEGQVPLSSTTPVLNVLISRILLDSDEFQELLEQYESDSILDIERALASQASAIPGRTVWDLLLKKLWAIGCADALEVFIGEIPKLLAKTRDQLLKERDEGVPPAEAGKIVRSSPLGIFIRRCNLEYSRLQFQDTVSIWLDFVAYRMPTKGAFTRKDPHCLQNSLDVNLAELSIDATHPLAGIMFRSMMDRNDTENKPYSTYDAERLLEFQVSELQNLGGRLPDAMKTRLRQMSQSSTTVPKLVHYLKFLDSWRAGNFSSAFDNLHRYFDYTMHTRDRVFYQYALLNLAILHADFSCHEEAMSAMTEAISTARENRDVHCLNYCMSWLYHFGRSFPAQMAKVKETGILGNEREGLQFLKSRAKEAEMWTLLSTTTLSEAKISLQRGESLAHVFENITKSQHINTVKNLTNCTGPALLMKATLFTRIGQTHMALSCGERFLLCHTADAPLEDVLKATVRQANLLSQMGRLAESAEMLANIPTHILRVLKYQTYHTTVSSALRARRLLHRNNLVAASQIIARLVSQQPHPEIETNIQITLLQIDLLTRQRKFLDAIDLIEPLATRAPIENNDVLIKAKLMCLKASLFAKSDKHHMGFSLAVRVVDMCYKARILPLLWEGVIVLAAVLNASYEFVAAKDLLTAILPGVLESVDCELSGRCYNVLGDSYVGLAGLAGSQIAEDDGGKNKEGMEAEQKEREKKRKECMDRAFEMFEKAREQYGFIEDLEGQLECMAKMGRIYAWRAETVSAVDVGERYMELKRRYEEEEEI